MAEHFLDSRITHSFWDRSYPPRLVIDSGDLVIFECEEGAGGQVTPATTATDLAAVDESRIHALVGPVCIHGAEVGDTLEVEILDLQHKGWGFTHFTHKSILADEFKDPYLHHWRLEGSNCYFKEGSGIVVPYEPFCGTMGVAPSSEGRFDTFPPRENGGNMDIRGLGRGSKLWLPVWTAGALFSVGDCHAAQGDGEVCGTAIECPMTVTLRFRLCKNLSLPGIQFMTLSPMTVADSAGYHVTTGLGPDLYKDSQEAIRSMIGYLVDQHGLSREEAFVLCSAAVDLKISSIVNKPNLVVSAYLPLSIFH